MRSARVPAPRPTVAAMSGYVPGEQPARGQEIIKLNTNENPFAPSPAAVAAIRSADPEDLRRYSDPHATVFRKAAAKHYGLTPEHVIAGNGSDDILNIVIRTFVDPGQALVYPEPTYSLYPVLAELAATKARTVPWRAGWKLPSEELCNAGAQAIFFANPNAPSGTAVSAGEVADLAEKFSGVVLVDEAYGEFAQSNCLALLADHPNVVISRTMSKSYALAGLRFGYALAHPEVVAQMNKVKDSYNCDALAIAAATAALQDNNYAQEQWRRIRAERSRLTAELTARGFAVLPSEANFVLAEVPGGDGKACYEDLKAQGILVRHFDKPGLSQFVRITVGTPEQTNALLEAL